eukprot:scaffold1116_cov180-Ochromonas_danica.AAC.2
MMDMAEEKVDSEKFNSSLLEKKYLSDDNDNDAEDNEVVDTEDVLSILNEEISGDEHLLGRSTYLLDGEESSSDAELAEEEGEDEDEEEGEEKRRSYRERPDHNKIFELISSLQGRDFQGDEWENDDDAGYITISLTEDEFFDLENRNLVKIFAEKSAISSPKSPTTISSTTAVMPPPPPPLEDSKEDEDKILPPPPLVTNDETESVPVPPAVPPVAALTDGAFGSLPVESDYVPAHRDPFQCVPDDINNTMYKRQSMGERRRSEIIGQHRFEGADGGLHCYFNLKVIFEPYRTGFEESKDFKHQKGTLIAGRYEVYDVLGTAAFSTALQCIDLAADVDNGENEWVCLKVIKNNKDFFDQSLDEIKLLQYINSRELLKENLYEFGRYIRENSLEIYYTLPRLKRIAKQLIHCDVKPENIVIKSFSRCEVKLIDFGSSCFTTDHLTTYIQSRSYRAPEVILGHNYDGRIDIWSVGAVLAELYTNYVLFQNDSVATMLSRIIGILGPFPREFLAGCREAGKYFTASNIVYEREENDPSTFHLIFPKKTTLRDRLHMPAASTSSGKQLSDEDLFVDFIRSLLYLDCDTRPTATQALAHPWLADADTVQFTEYIIGQPRAAEDIDDNVYEDDEDYEEDDLDDLEGDEGEDQDDYDEDATVTAAQSLPVVQPDHPYDSEGASTQEKYKTRGEEAGDEYDGEAEDEGDGETEEAVSPKVLLHKIEAAPSVNPVEEVPEVKEVIASTNPEEGDEGNEADASSGSESDNEDSSSH